MDWKRFFAPSWYKFKILIVGAIVLGLPILMLLFANKVLGVTRLPGIVGLPVAFYLMVLSSPLIIVSLLLHTDAFLLCDFMCVPKNAGILLAIIVWIVILYLFAAIVEKNSHT